MVNDHGGKRAYKTQSRRESPEKYHAQNGTVNTSLTPEQAAKAIAILKHPYAVQKVAFRSVYW